MRRPSGIRAWCTLSLAIAAIVAGLVVAKQYAEQHLLASILGSGTEARQLKLHWLQAAGCAEEVDIPLTHSVDRGSFPLKLHAGKLWFVYDQSALLRKRLILPRVIVQDAVISANLSDLDAPSIVDFDTTELSLPSDAQSNAQTWVDEIRKLNDTLVSQKFVEGRQVSIDADMLSERMQSHFGSVHQQAVRILSEARDIQQQLAGLNNVLRHEAQVIASRERLEQLKGSLIGLKSQVTRVDRTLADEQARVRAALLTEKDALDASGKEFQARPATDTARIALEALLAECLREPARYSLLLTDLMNKPFEAPRTARGRTIRHFESDMACFAVTSAQLGGIIETDGNRLPFHATGSFAIMPDQRIEEIVSTRQGARWQMAVGENDNLISLDGHSRHAPHGSTHIVMRCESPGHIQATCEVMASNVTGTGQLQLRELFTAAPHAKLLAGALHSDKMISELMEGALATAEEAPEVLDYEFKELATQPKVELSKEAIDWLANRLARSATRHVTLRYDDVAERLDAHVQQKLEAITRNVAVSRNETEQHLNQQLEELRKLQANVLNSLQQRAGTDLARKPASDVLR